MEKVGKTLFFKSGSLSDTITGFAKHFQDSLAKK